MKPKNAAAILIPALVLGVFLASCNKKDEESPAAPAAPPPADTATSTHTSTPVFTPTVTPTPTETGTPTITPAITPTPYDTPSCGAAAVTLGNTQLVVSWSISAVTIRCQRHTLAQPATFTTMTLNVQSTLAGLSANLGIYDEASGKPNNLLTSTGLVPCLKGWNTFPLASPVTLSAGDYWIATSYVPVSVSYVGASDAGSYIHAVMSPASPGALPNPAGGPTTLSDTRLYANYALGCP